MLKCPLIKIQESQRKIPLAFEQWPDQRAALIAGCKNETGSEKEHASAKQGLKGKDEPMEAMWNTIKLFETIAGGLQ
ncbi:hypothetical protein ACN6MY_09690 [Peribacillus sp. B-H-3]|jgi:hypothetical protein|uniref:hypothetical protein n=1 Tax=Peribacillus sp. B-H-3 TaxID=3400420 RepID=UPI003B016AF4